MITTNERWTEFRDKLINEDYRTLWSIEGNRRNGLTFDIVCMTTERGATIFQVWRDGGAGFNVYTSDTSPNVTEECFEHLTARRN